MTDYDAWLSTNPRDMDLDEITFTRWNDDPELQECYPFDETKCAGCGVSIGGWLEASPETGHDVARFTPIFVAPDEQTYCEDCTGEAE
jgi:hypothetical protein